MNKKALAKQLGIAALALGVAVGCASTPEPEPAPEPEAAEPVGMSAEARAAIAEAEALNKKASSMGCAWRDTGKLIDAAKAEGEKGNNFRAIAIANRAKQQAENAIKQCEEERNKVEQAETQTAVTSYTVVRGDSLWGISAMQDIYNDPYLWPLIYKANSGAIRDADLIYPGQVFSIERNALTAEVNAAIAHAKNRGAWSVGQIEASDREYLAQ